MKLSANLGVVAADAAARQPILLLMIFTRGECITSCPTPALDPPGATKWYRRCTEVEICLRKDYAETWHRRLA